MKYDLEVQAGSNVASRILGIHDFIAAKTLWMLVVVAALLSMARPALADPKIIDMKDGFPSEDLPLGDAFSVALAPNAETKAAHGVFFEYANGIFGSKAGSEIDHCSQLAQYATPLFPRFRDAPRGDTNLGDLFEQVKGSPVDKWNGLKARRAFLLPSWKPPATPVQGEVPTPTLRIPKTSFFQRGAHYCFVVVEEQPRSADDTVVAKLLETVADAISTCPTPAGTKLETDACLATALEAIAAAKGGFSATERESLRDNFGLALKVAVGRKRLNQMLVKFQALTPLVPAFPITSPFGNFIKSVLTIHAGVIPDACKPNPGESLVGVDTSTGAVSLKWNLAPPAPASPAEVSRPCDLTKVLVGSATLADFTILAEGKVLLNGKQVPLGDLKNEALASDLFEQPEKYADDFKHVGTWLDSMSKVLENAAPAPDEMAAQAWATSASWSLSADVSPDDPGPGALQVRIDAFASALSTWSPALATVTINLASFNLAAIDASVGLNPSTWVFSFLTPTVGYATTSDSFGIPTIALDLYAFANAADEPMWTNGSRDLRRLLSLELGVAPKTKTFGPNDRYSGPGDLPPLLLGAGVHVIPYVTFGMGALFVDAKRSTLPDEAASLHPLFYFNASVQANIPDIVASLVTSKKTTGE